MRRSAVLLVPALLLLACSDDGGDGPDSPLADAAADTSTDAPPAQIIDAGVPPLDSSTPAIDARAADASTSDAALREVPCVDEQFARLMLFEAPSTGPVREEGTTAGEFVTFIDAAAGGLMTNQSFTYARFTASGLQKVEIGDEVAFSSLDWDIAFRRYVFRTNGGVGGPGDVRVGRTAAGTTFAGLSAIPADLPYRSEAYYTESCEYVADVGIGAPVTALSSFWSYTSCLQMTHNVYVLALQSGRHVKLEVLSYYPPDNQKRCDDTGAITQPSGAGNLRVRWAFVD
ncbi:MAG: HmuY family protein [Polyangiales bacterium]